MRGPIVARYIHTGAFYEIHNRTEISNQKSQSSARKSPVWQSYKIWKLVFFSFIFHSFLSFLSLFPPCFFRFLSAATPSAARARACVHLIVHLSIYRSRCWKQSTLSADLSDASPANNRNPSIVVWRWNHLGFFIPNALCLWIQKSIKVPYMNLPRGTSSIIIQDSSRTAQKDIYSIKNWYMYLLCTSLAFYQD